MTPLRTHPGNSAPSTPETLSTKDFIPLATCPRSADGELPLDTPDLFINKVSSSSGEILSQLSSVEIIKIHSIPFKGNNLHIPLKLGLYTYHQVEAGFLRFFSWHQCQRSLCPANPSPHQQQSSC